MIIPFPASKRTGKIERTATILATKKGKGADAYWKQVLGGLERQMKTAGISQDIIEHELKAFTAEVFSQLRGRGERPGGGAG